MKKILVLFQVLFTLMLYGQKYGQLAGSFESNSQLYVDDDKIGGFNEENKFRSNNYLKIDYYVNNFTAEVKFESYAPQALLNFSPNLNKTLGVATYAIKYKSKKLDFTLGNFYDQFGSGLIFRSWEDRQLGLDNSIRGFRIKYQPKNLNITAFYGKQRVGFKQSNGELFGLNSEYDFLSNSNKFFMLGFSYIGRKQKLPPSTVSNLDEITNMYSGRINFSNQSFYSSIEYVNKGNDALVELGSIIDTRLFKGNALLFNMGYTKKGFGFDATFRRLENMAVYTNREVYANEFNDQIINYIPSLTKQHSFSLSNIYVYQSQTQLSFNPFGKIGEIGAQFDLFYKFKEKSFFGGNYGTLLSLNYSQWNRLKASFNLTARDYNTEFLGFGDKNYSDLNIEINKKWSSKISSMLIFMNVYYDKEYIEEKVGQINANILATDLYYHFNQKKSVHLQLQHLWTRDDQKNWVAASLEHSLSNKFSIFINDMYNYGNDNEFDKVHFYNIGSNYSHGSSRLTLIYGRQRGGLICIGGVCRFVPNSTGLSINLSSSF
ncbi:MAG: DUF6029 family protein [Aureibaculum sp.]|nr:DUF6029 family protein [Aureibaculum sp.]